MAGLDALFRGRMAALWLDRDWELLGEVARLAQQDAPTELAATDPALFETWRNAVTRYHRAGWTHMTPLRVLDAALSLADKGKIPKGVVSMSAVRRKRDQNGA